MTTFYATRPWYGWFQQVQTAITLLGDSVDIPPLNNALFEDDKRPVRIWGAGFFQSVSDAINRLNVTALIVDIMPPPPLATAMLYGERVLGPQLAWVGYFQKIYTSLLALGVALVIDSGITAAPLAAEIVGEN